ncbi:MAG: hemerythrin domain-containing protein [Ignavibacteriae bacterium]|nr:hemerythrin domain-containing protein [Ignavibacteriota bacterium]
MERHESLIPFSREHHEGLLLAVRLQQGKQALERLWSHDPKWQAEYVVKFFEEHLEQHFDAEERFLFPQAEKFFGENSRIIEWLRNEHVDMKNEIEFFRNPNPAELETRLKNFGQLLESHIRCEEREFFPMFEDLVDEQEIVEIGRKLKENNPHSDGVW